MQAIDLNWKKSLAWLLLLLYCTNLLFNFINLQERKYE
jgi:hypothetical protein